jgi:protein TonB
MQEKKSQQASLEDKKIIYVLMGFIFVLSLCYVALEWTEKEVTKYEVTDSEFLFEEEVEIQQTTQETPPPPPPPAVQEVEVLNVVEDNVETESIEINTEDDKETEVVIAAPVEAPVEEEEEEVVFVVVESMPEFPGGQQALFKYLAENVKYPVIAQENGIQGRVICQFVVNKDGKIVDVEVVRSGGDPSLDKEAVRVIKSMPNWKAGKQRGKAVRVKYTLPVNFKLQ